MPTVPFCPSGNEIVTPFSKAKAIELNDNREATGEAFDFWDYD